MEEESEKRMSAKLKAIMDNPSHPLCVKLRQLRSTFSHRPIRRRGSKHSAGHHTQYLQYLTVYINSLYVVRSHTVCLSEDFLHAAHLHEVPALPALRPGPSHFSGALWVFTSDEFPVRLWLQCSAVHSFSNHFGEKSVFRK